MKSEAKSLKYLTHVFKQKLIADFKSGKTISCITHSLTLHVDKVLLSLWKHFKLDIIASPLCLIALGSYGRNELQPYSDLDLLILYQAPIDNKTRDVLSSYIQALWDHGFTIGHQVTCIEDCIELASQNISVISNLMSMRYLVGSLELFECLKYKSHASQLWPAPIFFKVKWQEQLARYKKFTASAYHLEPNIKQGPGGLRDIQMILWLAQRCFGDASLTDSYQRGFLTENEHTSLINCQHFLWKVRFALHTVAERSEERLLFHHQKQIALLLGYQDNTDELAIEQFMKNYFSVIKTLRELNDMLIQLFRERLFYPSPPEHQALPPHFQIINHYIEANNIDTFIQHPTCLLTLFEEMVKRPSIKGVRANTIRLIRESKDLIDSKFRHNPKNTKSFMTIIKHSADPHKILSYMNRYGLLGRYIPEFSDIIGQMQYDLFHIYTVDQHSLLVIKQLFNLRKKTEQFQLFSNIYEHISKPELLLLAALFHDIGKGRGGCHSAIGAKIAYNFCRRHQLEQDDLDLVCWLVANHLLLSQTAQRKDIDDIKTISAFCKSVNSIHRLNYLYLLTVADICATNPKLWNSWKDGLLKSLYFKAHDHINHKEQPDECTTIAIKQKQVLKLLSQQDKKEAKLLWPQLKTSYFLHEPVAMIAKHTTLILQSSLTPPIEIYPKHESGGTQVFIYQPHLAERFSITTTLFYNLNLNVVDARIHHCENQFDLDTYIIFDENNSPYLTSKRTEYLKQNLINHLTPPVSHPSILQRQITRYQRHFNSAPKLEFSDEPHKQRTQLFLIASDIPGLLAHLATIFKQLGIELHSAKVTTAGERVEDVFYLSYNNAPINFALKEQLSEKIEQHLQAQYN